MKNTSHVDESVFLGLRLLEERIIQRAMLHGEHVLLGVEDEILGEGDMSAGTD